MNGRITHLHNHYRVIGNHSYEGILANRLDHIAAETLPDVLAHTLQRAFNDDQTVYILRQVKARLALTMNQHSAERPIARQWAGHLAQSVVRTIFRTGQEGIDWVRFDNQAVYIAQFIADMVYGRAQFCWFYFPLVSYSVKDTPAAVGQVLLDNREWLPQILTHLRRKNVLDAVLDRLDQDTLQSIWTQEPRTPESLRPLFIQTLQLVETLQLWQPAQPTSTGTLFDHYLATGPAAADWQDRRSLAVAVLDIWRYLAKRGYLNLTRITEDAIKQHLVERLSEWDWLDSDWLIQVLPAHWPLLLDDPPETSLPVRPLDHGPTPRQKTVLDDLLAALIRDPMRLDFRQPDAPVNSLRLYSLLVTHAPQWEEERLAKDLIQRLLDTWAWLQKSHSPPQALAKLQNGDISGAISTLPFDKQPLAASAFGPVSRLGATAIAILQRFGTREEQSRPIFPKETAVPIETACAGLFLLLRPVLDAHLPWLVRRINFLSDSELSPLAALLMALGARWAGEAGVREGQIEPGIGRLAGLAELPTWDALRAQWAALTPAAHGRFQFALLQILAGQRLLNRNTMFLYQVNLPDTGPALVAGDDSGRLWLLGQVQPKTSFTASVQSWRNEWQAATGVTPTIVTDELLLPALTELPDVQPPTDSLYLEGKEALIATFASLSSGRLDVPQADLTIGLTAVSLIRLWARWLRQFADSSISYLLTNMIHRAGRLLIDDEAIVVEMETRPLDMVLEMAGYLDELERVPWLEPQRVRFKRRGLP